jgi:stage II sporulation protein GA (sporulation sigma-E factor processing peptidase)
VAAAGVMKQLYPSVKGVVYVPYQSVGTSRGILPAVFIDRMEIEQEGGRYSLEKPLIAITKQELSPSGEYQILIQKSD